MLSGRFRGGTRWATRAGGKLAEISLGDCGNALEIPLSGNESSWIGRELEDLLTRGRLASRATHCDGLFRAKFQAFQSSVGRLPGPAYPAFLSRAGRGGSSKVGRTLAPGTGRLFTFGKAAEVPRESKSTFSGPTSASQRVPQRAIQKSLRRGPSYRSDRAGPALRTLQCDTFFAPGNVGQEVGSTELVAFRQTSVGTEDSGTRSKGVQRGGVRSESDRGPNPLREARRLVRALPRPYLRKTRSPG